MAEFSNSITLIDASNISTSEKQHFWFNSMASDNFSAGAYITNTKSEDYINSSKPSTYKKGGHILATSNGIEIGHDGIGYTTVSQAGLTVTKGGIRGGTQGQGGFIYLSTEPYGPYSINGSNNVSDWKEIIGTKFGVAADGSLYASNANISGKITVGSGSNVYTTDNVNPLVIGGRNLLLDTDIGRVSPASDKGSAYVSPAPTLSDYGNHVATDTETYFTYSFNYEVIGNTADAAIIYVQMRGTAATNSTLKVKNAPMGYYSKTFKLTSPQAAATSTTCNVRLQNATDGAVLTVWNIKLEIGNKATDWSPAPEDTDAAISDISDIANRAYNRQTTFNGRLISDSGTYAKQVKCSDFTSNNLISGTKIDVFMEFPERNAAALTLNVNSTGAINVYVGNSKVSATNRLNWLDGCTIGFVYVPNADGNNSPGWVVADTPPSYYGETCITAESTDKKEVLINKFVLYKGTTITVPMIHTNTASTPKLRIKNSSGITIVSEPNIYFGTGSTSPTKANGYAWPEGAAVIFTFDGQYWRFGNQTFIDAGNILTGSISADRIKANVISAVNGSGTGQINANKIKVEDINIGSLGGSIGGANLALQTIKAGNANSYCFLRIPLTQQLKVGKTYTFQAWGVSVDSGSNGIRVYVGGGSIALTPELLPDANGYIRYTFTFTNTGDTGKNPWLNIYNPPNDSREGQLAKIERWKLEEGDVPTAFVSAADDSFSGLNLLNGTADMLVGSGGHAGGHFRAANVASATPTTITHVAVTNPPVKGIKGAVRLTNNNSEAVRIGVAQNEVPNLKIGKQYTLSCWVRASTSSNTITIRLQPAYYSTTATGTATAGISGNLNYSIDGTYWTYLRFTGTLTGTEPEGGLYSAGYVYCYNVPSGSWVEVCGLKLEEGSVANGWVEGFEAKASSYITHINETGIKIHPFDSSGNDYLQINSNEISFYRANQKKMALDDSKLIFYDGTGIADSDKYAEFGSTIKIFKPTTGKAAVTIDSSGATFDGKIQATSGFIGQNASKGFTIADTAIYNPSTKSKLDSDTVDGIYLGTDGIALGRGVFTVSNTGNLIAKAGTIGGFSLNATQLNAYGTASGAGTSNTGLYRVLIQSIPGTNGGNAAVGVATRSTTSDSWVWQAYMSYNGQFVAKQADIKGKITATSGTIGSNSTAGKRWQIGSTSIYNGTDSITSTVSGTYIGIDGIRNYKDTNTYVNIKDGKITAIGADIKGKITATSGSLSSVSATNFTFTSGSIAKAVTIGGTAASTVLTNISDASTTATNAATAAANASTAATNAAKTATTYVTKINDAGVRIHPSSTSNNSVVINADGMEVFRGGTADSNSVAFFGAEARVGTESGYHTEMTSSSIELGKGNSPMWSVMSVGGSQSVMSSQILLMPNNTTSGTSRTTTVILNPGISYTFSMYSSPAVTITYSFTTSSASTTSKSVSGGGCTMTIAFAKQTKVVSGTTQIAHVKATITQSRTSTSTTYTAIGYEYTTSIARSSMHFYGMNNLLWSGGLFMHGTQTIKLSESISSQPSGIVLVWSYYTTSAQNYDWHYTYIPKSHVLSYGGTGSGINCGLWGANSTFNVVSSKYVYVTNTEITGHENNTASGTGSSGIKYDNSKFVLRYVFGI